MQRHKSYGGNIIYENYNIRWWILFTCNIISIVLALTLMILSSYAFNEVSKLRNPVLDIKSNWQTKPIIKLLTTDSASCPINYENIIEKREWPGTVWGGDCEYSNTIKSELTNNAGDEKKYENGGLMVPPRSAISLNKFNSKQIGGQRSGEAFTETQRPKLSSDNKLIGPQSYKIGGNGDINTAYGVKESQLGPINDIKILSLSSFSSLSPNSNYTSISLGNNVFIVFTRNATSLPISKIKVTEGGVGINPKQYMKTMNRQLYKLLRPSDYGEGSQFFKNKTIDSRYTIFGSIDEHSLFDSGGVTNVIKTLPQYDLNANPQWNFYFSTYYKWDTQGEWNNGVSRSELVSIINTCDGVSRYQKIVGVITKFNLIFGTLGFAISLIMLHGSKIIHNILHVFLMANAGIIIGICLIFVFICIVRPHMCKHQFSRIENLSCSDELTSNILNDFIDQKLSNQIINILISTLLVLLVIQRGMHFILELGAKHEELSE